MVPQEPGYSWVQPYPKVRFNLPITVTTSPVVSAQSMFTYTLFFCFQLFLTIENVCSQKNDNLEDYKTHDAHQPLSVLRAYSILKKILAAHSISGYFSVKANK